MNEPIKGDPMFIEKECILWERKEKFSFQSQLFYASLHISHPKWKVNEIVSFKILFFFFLKAIFSYKKIEKIYLFQFNFYTKKKKKNEFTINVKHLVVL